MFQKAKLRRKIYGCIKEIKKIEQKRSRSQSALVEAILQHKTPDDADVDYFNLYTGQINEVRDEMHKYQKELEELDK